MKTLKELLYKVHLTQLIGNPNVLVRDFHADSRQVKLQDLFVAIKGTQTDGHQFISHAISNGAIAILCEQLPENYKDYSGVHWAVTSNAYEAFAFIANNFYDYPSKVLNVIGVTGTNGKTSTVNFLYQLFTNLGYPCGMISTIEVRVRNEVLPAQLTTPDAKQLQMYFQMMYERGCDYCFMEVSSIAVHQHRVAGTLFKAGIFTNITHDHLDYHGTFENYFACKQAFFNMLPSYAHAISNADDKNSLVMVQNSKAQKCFYGIRRLAHHNAKIIESTLEGLHLMIDNHELWVPLLGDFNAYNVLAAYVLAKKMEIDTLEILKNLSLLRPVKGRFELIKSPKQSIYAVVDYAHTPDALENVLKTLTKLKKNRIITVFGCGGNRDPYKRPLMGKIAANYSDLVIITSDNPRNENPKEIIDQIYHGIPSNKQHLALRIEDREDAIKTAVQHAQKFDIILIAGKGHETYQEINNLKIPFDDCAVVQHYFNLL